ncbi:MAG: GNAT family N-acetyltransferase [Flavobacteriales bacterium]|nr:GNAT family N-acetyltransferase [Flavobacteriales bacterium]
MDIQSLSYSTLLHQLSFSSTIIDKGTYKVIATPGLPCYYWGNFLMFSGPPVSGDFENWRYLFREEFKDSGCEHRAFAWDSISGEAGETQSFEANGYYFEYDEILTTRNAIRPTNYNSEITVRPLETDTDWKMRVELNVACGDKRDRSHINELGKHYRRDTQRFWGILLGAFLKNDLVGEMGLFTGGVHCGVVSMVKTHPDFRRRGVCRTLLYHTLHVGMELFRFKEFVMVADVNGVAANVYKSVGFEVVEHGASLIKRE